jgi:hypothetical protein
MTATRMTWITTPPHTVVVEVEVEVEEVVGVEVEVDGTQEEEEEAGGEGTGTTVTTTTPTHMVVVEEGTCQSPNTRGTVVLRTRAAILTNKTMVGQHRTKTC